MVRVLTSGETWWWNLAGISVKSKRVRSMQPVLGPGESEEKIKFKWTGSVKR